VLPGFTINVEFSELMDSVCAPLTVSVALWERSHRSGVPPFTVSSRPTTGAALAQALKIANNEGLKTM
jgi:hypothetical protein